MSDIRHDSIPKINVIDIGAYGGIADEWAEIGGAVKIYAFEPNAQECARLNKQTNSAVAHLKFFPQAISWQTGPQPFYATKSPRCASLMEPDSEEFQRYGMPESLRAHRGDVVQVIEIDAVTLDDFVGQAGIKADFVKIDTQGTEYELLSDGFKNNISDLIGIEAEMEFVPLYKNQKLFSELELFFRESGFQIFGLKRNMMKMHDGTTCTEEHGGRLLHADGLFFHQRIFDSALPKDEAIKSFLLARRYGLADLASRLMTLHELDGDLLARIVRQVDRRPSAMERFVDRIKKRLRPHKDRGRLVDFDDSYGF